MCNKREDNMHGTIQQAHAASCLGLLVWQLIELALMEIKAVLLAWHYYKLEYIRPNN